MFSLLCPGTTLDKCIGLERVYAWLTEGNAGHLYDAGFLIENGKLDHLDECRILHSVLQEGIDKMKASVSLRHI